MAMNASHLAQSVKSAASKVLEVQHAAKRAAATPGVLALTGSVSIPGSQELKK